MAQPRGRAGESSRVPPPPPQRQSHTNVETPPPYEAIMHQQKAFEKASSYPEPNAAGLMHNDPRSSSQQSLSPEEGSQSERRKLLCVFIHGFMGNETSFRSFPAHVHSLLAVLLAETHVVHTKVYPRYRSRGNITVARDSFSRWIEPHQDQTTDVVLLGHSMGGLLCAEIVLMPPPPGDRPLNHRIIGTINFDVPFLGMHPGIVKSGLASLFKPADEPKDSPAEGGSMPDPSTASTPPPRADTFWSKGSMDPNYNTPYPNDVKLPERKGWRNAWHFISKHSDNLTDATKKLVSSHLEFGGAMAKYGELKTRYARIRALEEEDGRIRQTVVESSMPPRVRFVNYYTASTGRPKKPASPHQNLSPSPIRRLSPSPHRSRHSSAASTNSRPTSTQDERESRTASTISVGDTTSRQGLSPSPSRPATSMRDLSPRPEMMSISPRPEDHQENWDEAMESLTIGEPSSSAEPSSDLPELPAPPKPLDLSFLEDPETRKAVEKEHTKAVKNYEKAVKERNKLIEGRQKAQDKQARKEQKAATQLEREETKARTKSDHKLSHSEKEALRLESERQRMEAEARRMRGEKEPAPIESPPPSVDSSRRPSTITTSAMASSTTIPTISTVNSGGMESLAPQGSKDEVKGPPKDRKFCNLPPKDSNGERDPCWVRVFMKDVDEVGAHCGLFFVDERYERLVGDVAERIEGWVKEDVDRRMLEGMTD